MISRDQLMMDIQGVDESNLDVLHRIIIALKNPVETITRGMLNNDCCGYSRMDLVGNRIGAVFWNRETGLS